MAGLVPTMNASVDGRLVLVWETLVDSGLVVLAVVLVVDLIEDCISVACRLVLVLVEG